MIGSSPHAHKPTLEIDRVTVETETESEEQFLLKSISQGNRHAFWQLWMLHQNYLYRRCQTWMGGNPLEAEEALSRARIKAWEKLPNNASKITNPKAWLTRMTHNLCVDIHRERQREATDSIEAIAAGNLEIVPSSSDFPELAMLRHELGIYIHRAIEALPPRLRDPFILYCYYQMSYRHIAQELNLSRDSVGKRIHRARSILQKQLKKYFSGLDNSLKPEVGESQFERREFSDAFIPKMTQCNTKPINYQVTATCLERFSLAWSR